MSRLISRAESWEKVYQALQNINFSAFDYDSIKQSLVDYIKLYYPEQFNDFIESSEFIAFLELFAYIGEQYAYRSDLNAHESILTVAQRKEAALRLARYISYNAARNIPARGLVKMTSLQTTEAIFDSKGRNLAGRKVLYNDPNNADWKEQFLLILNRVLQQPFGSVLPKERVQVDDVLFEVYGLNNNAPPLGIVPYNASLSGRNLSMELVPVALTSDGPEERRPESKAKFSILYGNDGLGDQSETTGFFMMTKQGNLQVFTSQFDGITPNQTYTIDVPNVNDTDVWVNQVNPDTLAILDDDPATGERSGEWQAVDLAFAQNIIFNTNPIRNKYEIETLSDDRVRLIFGDGEFANIPRGTLQFWFRTSAGIDEPIPQSAVVNKSGTFTYQDVSNRVQTFTFTFSLINSLQNSSPSEDIEHIRRIAPAVYYTQDRMVNGRDYNTFMLQDPSILKLRAVNRTFAGDSKYVPWHDPSDTYENVRMFGEDLGLYIQNGTDSVQAFGILSGAQLLNNVIQPLLSKLDFYVLQTYHGVPSQKVRTTFSGAEATILENEINNRIITQSGDEIELYLHFDGEDTVWNTMPPNGSEETFDQSNGSPALKIQRISTANQTFFLVTYFTYRVVAHSNNMRFWTVNDPNRPLNFDTLNSFNDKIVVLKANLNRDRSNALTRNYNFTALQQIVTEQGLPGAGLADTHRLIVVPNEIETDTLPDPINFDYLFNSQVVLNSSRYPVGSIVRLPSLAIVDSTSIPSVLSEDIIITGDGTISTFQYSLSNSIDPIESKIVDTLVVTSYGNNSSVTITLKDYAYLVRADLTQAYTVAENTLENIQAFIDQETLNVPESQKIWKRYPGRFPLNFAWLHSAPFYNMIDPAASNIHDMFLITRAYYNNVRQYLDGRITNIPAAPTPLQLRNSYKYLLDNRMISDTVVLHPGKFKVLFGPHAPTPLQASFKVIKSATSNLTDNQIKASVVDIIKAFFDINSWEFGETFYFTELSSSIHSQMPIDVSSVVLVPRTTNNQFGDLFQVFAREDEIFQPSISVNDIEIVQSYDSKILRQEPV